jgi:hypothetical protein
MDALRLSLALLSVALPAPASAHAAATARVTANRCQARHSHTIAASPLMRVFRVRGQQPRVGRAPDSFRYFACWRASGRRTRLGNFGLTENAFLQDVHFGGDRRDSRFIGFWVSWSAEPGTIGATLESADVRAGRIVHRNPYPNQTGPHDVQLRNFVESSAGSLAYVGTGGGGAGCFGVFASGPGPGERQLECLPPDDCNYDAQSPRRCSDYGLRYANGQVYWTVNGQQHSAPLA